MGKKLAINMIKVFGLAYFGLPLHSSQWDEQKACHSDDAHDADIVDWINHDNVKLLTHKSNTWEIE